MAHQVVTFEAPGTQTRVTLCRPCVRELEGRGVWPRSRHGVNCCDVYMGGHRGRCDRCTLIREGEDADEALNVG
jgi:hypothetical protein